MFLRVSRRLLSTELSTDSSDWGQGFVDICELLRTEILRRSAVRTHIRLDARRELLEVEIVEPNPKWLSGNILRRVVRTSGIG